MTTRPKTAPHIAICGIRGIPARYGGFETFAEELSVRLLELGYQVSVYCRPHVVQTDASEYRGVRLVQIPAIQQKYLETPVHSLMSFLHLCFSPVDAVLVCNAANAPFLWILKLRGIPVATNVDGIERLRAKWNGLGRLWYRLGEWCAATLSDVVISDAKVIQDYYRERYMTDSTLICYGFNEAYADEVQAKVDGHDIEPAAWGSSGIETEFGVKFGEYLLYVSRLEPENNALIAVEAYNRLDSELQRFPLVVVGDAPYAEEYKNRVRAVAGRNIIFTGFQFGERYPLLQLGAKLYIQATEVGGTHPALVEAMGFGNAVVANDTPEHREVIGDCGMYYRKNDIESLSAILSKLLTDSTTANAMRRAAYQRARDLYSWSSVAEQYDTVFRSLADFPRLLKRTEK